MTGLLFAAVERARLSDLLDDLGPEAPTLLVPWTTHDLAAHLVQREHDHLAGPGLVLPGAWARFAEQRRKALALRDFARLVTTFRSGPPPGLLPHPMVRLLASLNDFFVHHEDVRRAQRSCSPDQRAGYGRGALGQRHPRAVVSRAATARRRSRTSAGRNHPDRPGTARRTDSPHRRTPSKLLLYLFGRPSGPPRHAGTLNRQPRGRHRASFGYGPGPGQDLDREPGGNRAAKPESPCVAGTEAARRGVPAAGRSRWPR
jgi:uncharacterized protein (TIGR03085 family)